jgi:serine/threonine-protein kinase
MSDSLDPTTLRAQRRVGRVLRGKWHLERLIGVGGMAAVYAATHRNRMRGAVKMLHLELSADEQARSRFLREGYVANNVEHPGVVRVLDDDVAEDGSVFLVMELLEGQTVEALCDARPGRRLEIGEVLALSDDLLDVLAAAHERGVVHRDLKPENLFLTRKGELKILDFGIARLRDMTTTNATATGMAMGTPAFMPPEQALGNWDSVDARSDLWAVGATMYCLLAGRPPHHADTVQKLMLAAMTQPAPRLSAAAPHVGPQICAIVDCALAFEREARWPTARALQKAVREARGVAPHPFTPAPPPAPATVVSGAARSDPGHTPSMGATPVVAPGQPTASPVTASFSQLAPTQLQKGRRNTLAIAAISTIAVACAAVIAVRAGGAPDSPESSNLADAPASAIVESALDAAQPAAPPTTPEPTSSAPADPVPPASASSPVVATPPAAARGPAPARAATASVRPSGAASALPKATSSSTTKALDQW